MSAQAARLADGRLHLQHGPIDLVIWAEGRRDAVEAAYVRATAHFSGVLERLVAELPALRRPISDDAPLAGPVATRMAAAARRFAGVFVTPMAAVAGAVADEILAALWSGAGLTRAYVNNGGDIALALAPGRTLRVGLVEDPSGCAMGGALDIRHGDGLGGVATSGRLGRSFSLGIADAVTVVARDSAAADAAATLIANAVDVRSPAIARARACDIDPDSDLGRRLVTTSVGPLCDGEIGAALSAGAQRAHAYLERGLIAAAALFLNGRVKTVGVARLAPAQVGEPVDAGACP